MRLPEPRTPGSPISETTAVRCRYTTADDAAWRHAVGGAEEQQSGGPTFVVVAQTAEVRNLDDCAAGWRVRRPRDGRIFVQREARAPPVIAGEVLRHSRLRDLDAQLPEFAVDARRAPQRVGGLHLPDQRSDVGWHCAPASPTRP